MRAVSASKKPKPLACKTLEPTFERQVGYSLNLGGCIGGIEMMPKPVDRSEPCVGFNIEGLKDALKVTQPLSFGLVSGQRGWRVEGSDIGGLLLDRRRWSGFRYPTAHQIAHLLFLVFSSL